jgi:uncharacterized protein
MTRGVAADTVPIDPPVRIDRPTMLQRWTQLSFLHWPYEPHAVRALLPAELEVDTFDGAAWVGLIPFRLEIRRRGAPYVPWLARFAETNLRTYVVGPDGRRGIWFLSLDAARLPAVAVARTSYRLPYMWADASIHERGDTIRYRGSRRWPTPQADYDLTLRIGEAVNRPSDLERFLTARWHLFSPAPQPLPPRRLELDVTTVSHPPWPLFRADVIALHESLTRAAGLPAPGHDPVASFSPGVATRFAPRVRLQEQPSRRDASLASAEEAPDAEEPGPLAGPGFGLVPPKGRDADGP